MIRLIAAALLVLAATGPGRAQEKKVFTPAPVPNITERVSPLNRAGGPVGARRGVPFSGQPRSLIPGSGQATPTTTPNALRPTAPAPSLSR